MISLRHRAVVALFRLTRFREKFHTMIGGTGLKRHAPDETSGARQKDFEGFPFHWFDPKDRPRGEGVIVALHGGAFIAEAQPQHYKAYAKLAAFTGLRVYAPSYPLAPEHSPDAIRDWTRSFIAHVREHNRGQPLLLTGDSAGANLAMQMLAEGVAAERVVLWSPWLDIEMAHPDTIAADGRCALLAHGPLSACADAYASGRDKRDPALSPAFREWRNLPPMLILTGDRDLLHPDIVRFAAHMSAQDEPVSLITARGMCHDWMIFPTPEARKAIAQTAAFLTGA